MQTKLIAKLEYYIQKPDNNRRATVEDFSIEVEGIFHPVPSYLQKHTSIIFYNYNIYSFIGKIHLQQLKNQTYFTMWYFYFVHI